MVGNKHPTVVPLVAMLLVGESTDLLALRVAVVHKGLAVEVPSAVFLVLPLGHMDPPDKSLDVQLVVVHKDSSAVPLTVVAPV